MAHAVELDHDQMAAERRYLEHMAGESQTIDNDTGKPVDHPGDSTEQGPDPYEQWRDAIDFGLTLVHSEAFPEWEMSPKGRELILNSGAHYGAKYWPKGPAYVDPAMLPPWLQIVVGVALIAWKNFDRKTMTLKAMRPEPEGETQPDKTSQQQTVNTQSDNEGGKLAEFPG